MNKLEVGMYVRTKSSYIDKIININDFREPNMKYVLEHQSWWNDDILFIGEDKIYKASFNIIDLIEAGDYINGEMVMEADWINDNGEYEEGLAFPLYDGEDKNVIISWIPLKHTKIKTIVTKEQFKSMEYKVEQ